MRPEACQGSSKVLVVEDNPVCARLLAGVLSRRGYEVVAASDGVEAMRLARTERPQLIVLDVGVPGGDGLATLERLRALSETAGTPVVISTSRPGSQAERKAAELGADAFVPKPVESALLLDTVARLIRR
jgi:two-component system, OmpR family, alkaline phosphatase synthesis response regulator PhoP